MHQRRFLFSIVFFACCFVAPRATTAQVQVGGGVGYMFDQPDDFIVFTAEARMPVKKFIFSPRLDWYSGTGTNIQIDANFLYPLQLVNVRRLHPYVGLGGGISHSKVGDFSDTTPVMNWVLGSTLDLKSERLKLFATAQFSSGIDYGDTMVYYGGVLYTLTGR